MDAQYFTADDLNKLQLLISERDQTILHLREALQEHQTTINLMRRVTEDNEKIITDLKNNVKERDGVIEKTEKFSG